MSAHAIVGFILMLASAYAGYRYGVSGVVAVKAYVAGMESAAKKEGAAINFDVQYVIQHIKSLL